MKFIIILLFGAFFGVFVEAERIIPDWLVECYDHENYVALMYNKLPHNIQTFIAILRKIENYPKLEMDMPLLAVRLLHRFRYDGIVKNSSGGISYTPSGFEFYKNAEILQMMNDTAYKFPHQILNLQERCSLHFMLSSSIDKSKRGDELITCKIPTTRTRTRRSVKNRKYRIRRASSATVSDCPLTTGVISTEWGTISPGSVLAGIAAGLSPKSSTNTRWMATLAGDIAEVALRQGPKSVDYTDYKIGIEGHWDSTIFPHTYFIDENEDTEFTAAEIRGDLDGLIMATYITTWRGQMTTLKLSQLFDLYYGNIGVYQQDYRACNRRTHVLAVAPKDKLTSEAIDAAAALHRRIYGTAISENVTRYAMQATEELLRVIPTMNSDKPCRYTDGDINNKIQRPAVDLTLYVDTHWPFSLMKSAVTMILEHLEVQKYGSNFTMINTQTGATMIKSTNNLLEFYQFNETQYYAFSKGFDLIKSIDTLQSYEMYKLNAESELKIGGALSSVALFMPCATVSVSEADKKYTMRTLRKMSEEAPDTTILFLTLGTRERWLSFTEDPANDVVSVSDNFTEETRGLIDNVVRRIKLVPRRLINSQCGANWSNFGISSSHTVYLEPYGIQYFRLHPNYFITTDSDHLPTLTIQQKPGDNRWAAFTICSSRTPLINESNAQANCVKIYQTSHAIPIFCGADPDIYDCHPLYLSITPDYVPTSMPDCNDAESCRYPRMTRVIVSYENLRCGIAPGNKFPVIKPTKTPRTYTPTYIPIEPSSTAPTHYPPLAPSTAAPIYPTTEQHSTAPTHYPTFAPSTAAPIYPTTEQPSAAPTHYPTFAPSTAAPTYPPTFQPSTSSNYYPTFAPSTPAPTHYPTFTPSTTNPPTFQPNTSPTYYSTVTHRPSTTPTSTSAMYSTVTPSENSTNHPTGTPGNNTHNPTPPHFSVKLWSFFNATISAAFSMKFELP